MEKMNFLVKNISDNMFSQVASGDVVISIDRTSTTVEDLKKIKNLHSSLSNKGLEGTLRLLGVRFIPLNNPKFQVRAGDTIYVIIPSEKINQYDKMDVLPESCKLEVERWTIETRKKNFLMEVLKFWKNGKRSKKESRGGLLCSNRTEVE